jgi:hypothetical protein
MNKDQLNSVVSFHAVEAAYAAVSAVQAMPKAKQVAGVAVLFAVICEELKLDPSELINKAQRMSKDADGFFTREMKALRDYVQGELK